MNLLAVLAHPDDEAYFCGGTLARCAAEGHRVTLVCATRGERGEMLHPDLDHATYPKGEALGRLRTQELEAACQALGIETPVFLGYQDSGHPPEAARANADAFIHHEPLAVAERLLGLIAELQPHAVITFDPYGYYGHADHLLVHRAATAAFWAAERVTRTPPLRLFYPVRPRGNTPLMTCPVGATERSVAVRVDVSAQADRIRAALAAHGSQTGTPGVLEDLERDEPETFQIEHFLLGGLRGSFPEPPAADLFAAWPAQSAG